jgi:hypothetical protein
MFSPRLRQALFAAVLALAPLSAWATPCDDAIQRVEREAGLPPGLLRAIALVESGRTTAGRFAPWPWTVNSPEGGTYLDDRGAALQRIEDLRRRGHTNIDVGCMQINLRHHPDAFDSLAEAIDPLHNVRYAASFLTALERETGSWERAIGRYHSATPELSAAYRARVAARWDPQPPTLAPAPVQVASRPSIGPIVPTTPRIVAATEPNRAAEARPVRAAPGAIAGAFARQGQPVAYAPLERLAPAAAPGAVRPR